MLKSRSHDRAAASTLIDLAKNYGRETVREVMRAEDIERLVDVPMHEQQAAVTRWAAALAARK